MSATTLEVGVTAPADVEPSTRGGALSRLLQSWRKALRRQRQLEELARMDEGLLIDIGFAEEEIWRVRAREDFIPRAWIERKARERAA